MTEPTLADVAKILEDGKPFGFYERLFMRAYQIELTQEIDDDNGRITDTRSRVVTHDTDIAQAYRLLIEMRKALMLCGRQFKRYGQDERHQLETSTLTLVERSKLERDMERNLGIADIIERLLIDTPMPERDLWKPISSAPQDGYPIRLLGKREDGSTYVETGQWANIEWSVQSLKGLQAPTHWMELETLPEGY